MRLKAEHEYLKLILSIGGGSASQNFATVAASAATRDNFGRSAKGLVEASGFDGIDSESADVSFESLLTLNKLTGNIRPTPSKAETFSRYLLLFDCTFKMTVTSCQRHCQLGSGRYRTSTFTRPKIISIFLTSWPMTLQGLGHKRQDIMPSYSPAALVKLQVPLRLIMYFPLASRPTKSYSVSLFTDGRS